MRIMERKQASSDNPKDSNNFDKARPKNTKYNLRRNRNFPNQVNHDIGSDQGVANKNLEPNKAQRPGRHGLADIILTYKFICFSF